MQCSFRLQAFATQFARKIQITNFCYIMIAVPKETWFGENGIVGKGTVNELEVS